jgi:hypothetical protein
MAIQGTVTRYGRQKFGSDRARPVITGVYAGVGGWVAPPSKGRLTRETATDLRALGFTMIRVRWRFRTHEIILRRYLS